MPSMHSVLAAAGSLGALGLASARTIFPKPQRQTDDASSLFLPIDARSFQFKAAAGSPTNDILDDAFNRYYAIAIGQTGALAHASRTNLADAAVTPITGLEVTIESDSTDLTLETNQSYTLTVAAPTIKVAAKNVFGALNGLESFSQLVGSDATINGTFIEDNPRYQFRATSASRARSRLQFLAGVWCGDFGTHTYVW